MKIVLNRDIKDLGKVGDIVVVKDGYGRNFLLPKGYAIVATKANVAKLQEKLDDLKKQNEILFNNANKIKEILEKEVFNTVRQAADDDTIYGSVRTRDVYNFVCDLIRKNNISFSLDIGAVKIAEPIKALGQYLVNVELFSGVECVVRLNVCRAIADFESDVVAFDNKRAKFLMSGSKDSKEVKENANKILKQEVAKVESNNDKESKQDEGKDVDDKDDNNEEKNNEK